MMAPSMVMTHGPPPPLAHQELPQPFHAHLTAVAPPLPHPQLPPAPLPAEPPPPPAPPAQPQPQPTGAAAAAGTGGGTAPVVGQILSSTAEEGTATGATGAAADGKEKTPMCLINELARSGRVMSESGGWGGGSPVFFAHIPDGFSRSY